MSERKTLTKLMIFAALLGCGQTALLVCLPSLSSITKLNTAQMASVVALGSGMFLIGNPVWGYLSDRWSRRGALLVGVAGYAISFLVIALALHQTPESQTKHTFYLLLAARLIYGLTASSIYPTIQAWALDSLSKNTTPQDEVLATKTLTQLAAAVNAGRLAGPVIAAPLLIFGPVWVLLALSLFATFLAVLVTAIPNAVTHFRVPPKREATTTIWLLLLAGITLTMILGALQYSLGFLLSEYLTSSKEAGITTALVLIFCTLFILSLQVCITSKLNEPWVNAVPLACLSLITGCALLFVNSLVTLLIAVIMISSAAATLAPIYQSEAAKGVGSRGRTIGLFGMAHALGGSLGTWVAGWLLLDSNLPLFIGIGVLSVISSLMLLPRSLKYRQRTKTLLPS
ncbi:MFS transporter [Arenicella sp. 4NH20-0111]|uniref:MFS transporter n=1 Tax=Arenicella sp. 4NH20-0111 TaxID=3127648 RepID=UPI0031072217